MTELYASILPMIIILYGIYKFLSQKVIKLLGIMTYTCNANTWEVKAILL